MSTKTVAIASTVGLHARPAALFVQKVTQAGVPVTIGRPDQKAVNAASMLGVMSLGAKHGEVVELTSDDEAVLDDLVAFLAVDHDGKN